MKVIIGDTGLIGKTLTSFEDFDLRYNSKNLNLFQNQVQNGSELLLSCLPATKWKVNQNLVEDFNNMISILDIISKKNYSKVTLISTIDVYNDSPLGSDEDYSPNVSQLSYGNNRYIFEMLVKKYLKTDNLKIFRLPALFNNNIKKNIIYDLLNDNNVSSINSNSAYQWYNLDNLSTDIKIFSDLYPDSVVFNFFPEPIETVDIVSLFPKYENIVQFMDKRLIYDYTTKFSENRYFCSKKIIINEIKTFINEFGVK